MKQNFSPTHLFADGEYSREQLGNILQAAGFSVTDDTFRKLEMKDDGNYENETFRIMGGNVLVGLTKQQASDSVFEGKFQRLADVLGQRYLSEIVLTDENPLTLEKRQGIAYVKARLVGMEMKWKEVGGKLLNSYKQGFMTEEDVAARIYYPDMLNMHEALYRKAIRNNATAAMVNGTKTVNDKQIIYIHQAVHKDQLRAIIDKCGFHTSSDTFRNLNSVDKDVAGHYRNVTLSVENRVATVLPKNEAEEYLFRPERKDLHEVLGRRAITEAVISRVNPQTGIEAEPGHGYLLCKFFGEMTAPMPIGKSLMHLYEKGHTTADQIAASVYRNAMVQHFHSVTTKVDCGHRWTDGTHTLYYAEHNGEGEIYKDMKAFDEKEGICYLSGHALECYESDKEQGVAKPIEHYGDTYRDLVNYARMHALRNPEKVARHCLQNCTWQSPTTELDDFHNNCDIEDILELDEEIQDTYDLFIEDCGKAPNYADVYITYKDGEGQRDTIALNPEAGARDDESVVFTCQNFEEFKKLADKNNKEDFYVDEIYGYYYGDRDFELRRAKHEPTLPEREELPERVIQVDMNVSSEQLRNILNQSGISLPDVLPGIDEQLPLDNEGKYVTADYLRVVDGMVYDWTSEYQFRDAERDQPGLMIESLKQMAGEQHLYVQTERQQTETVESIGKGETENIPWYKDLSRISDVNVFRNPMNKQYVEFRMRCKIDGVQQLGRVITAQHVEDLANGADRKEMAAQVFAREMTLKNPQKQDKSMKW